MAQFVGDVFGLNAVYEKQLENIANGNFASWPEGSAYGYYAGGGDAGNTPPLLSSIARIDFSTQTTSNPSSNLLPGSPGMSGSAGVSNFLYGYFGGGQSSPSGVQFSNINRLDFSNETVSNPGKNLPSARRSLGATQSDSYGYFGGGFTPTLICAISRLDFSSETISDPGNNLPTVRSVLAATSSNSYGYFGGGDAPATVSTITRLDFTSETLTNITPLPTSVRRLAGASSSLYGYFGAGETISTVSRLDFSNETINNTTPLPVGNIDLAATSSGYHGYFAGGVVSASLVSTINRLDFSNETVSNTSPLPIAIAVMGTLSGGQSTLRGKGFKTYGYFGGGKTPKGDTSQIDRLDFSNETVSSGILFPELKQGLNATSNNYYGYFSGGEQPVKQTTTISRFDFSNETTNNLNNFLPVDQANGSTVTSSNSYGYFGGGSDPSPVGVLQRSIISRLDFSNETIKVITPLPSARRSLTATSSSSYGYFGGGIAPTQPSINTITRIDFSNETVSNPGKNLPSARDSLAAISNSSFGYFGGGNTSIISRLDFSNETASDPGKNFPPVSRNDLAGTPSSSFGYFGGGGSFVSTITRLDFSSETVNDITSKLSNEVGQLAAVSNSN